MTVREIAVIRATGHQGGGLARAILADDTGAFAVRAVTLDPGSERARQLAKLGAQVVQADLDDERSLHAAFAGAYGAYVVTDFFADIAGLAIFRHPEYIGRTVSIARAHASGEEIAEMISEAAGEKVHYRPLTWEEFRSLPIWSAVTAANAFQYFAETERTSSRATIWPGPDS